MHHKYDVLVVGAGGAGLMAALYAAKGDVSVAVISKLYPTRSHTGAAQGAAKAREVVGQLAGAGVAELRGGCSGCGGGCSIHVSPLLPPASGVLPPCPASAPPHPRAA